MAERVYETLPLNGILPGLIYLQNLPSMVVSHVLNPQPGETILDMCASPGINTTTTTTTTIPYSIFSILSILIDTDLVLIVLNLSLLSIYNIYINISISFPN